MKRTLDSGDRRLQTPPPWAVLEILKWPSSTQDRTFGNSKCHNLQRPVVKKVPKIDQVAAPSYLEFRASFCVDNVDAPLILEVQGCNFGYFLDILGTREAFRQVD